MKIYSVSDPEFRPYGKVLTGYDTSALVAAMQTVPMPERGTAYEPAIEALETCGIFDAMQNRAYGGLPIQIGMCWGYNTKLNCLEYHRDSEINVGEQDFILLLAKKTRSKTASSTPRRSRPSASRQARPSGSTARRPLRAVPDFKESSASPSSCRRARTRKSPHSSRRAKRIPG